MASLANLRSEIREYFSLDEIKILAADLDIDFDELEGKAKSVVIQSLLEFIKRRNRLNDLIDLLSEQRSSVDWYKYTTQQDWETSGISSNEHSVGSVWNWHGFIKEFIQKTTTNLMMMKSA